MRDYSKISPAFWTGKTGRAIRALGPEAQVVAMYLLTSPHANMIGMYWLPVAYISADTGCPIEGASKALRSLIEAGFCRYCEETETVWVLEMAAYQIAESLKPGDKRVESIRKMLEESQAPFAVEFFDKYGTAFCLKNTKGLGRGIEAPPKPVNSEQRAESSKDQKNSPSDLSLADANDQQPDNVSQLDSIPCQLVADAYNAACGETFPPVSKLTDKRKRAIKARWLADTTNDDERRRTNSLDYWRRFFAHCASDVEFFRKAASGEHRGEHAGWTPSFDFLMREDTWLGVREGRFK